MAQKFICPMPGCGREAEYVGYAAEEMWTKNVEPIDVSTLKMVSRNILVRCPVHGKKIVQKFGHHVDTPGPFQGAKVGRVRQEPAGR